MGNFQRQREVVPKWLLRATELADEFISRDHGDALLRLHIYRTTLAAYAELKGNFDASLASEEALEDARQLIAQASDPLYKQQIERVLGETLLHSAKIERTRGRFETAMRYANNAIALVEKANDHDQLTDHDRYLKGQLYVLVGSLYAVHKQDHQEAVTWYEKASPLLGGQAISPLVNAREHGEIQVSMGLSHWETGEHQKAVSLTQQGAELMKQAVQQGTLQMEALAVPYGNLATMHSKLGNQEHSRKFAELAAKLEQPGDEATRR
jgi:tetratricopeptide (TPR) repeat protein